MSSDWCDKVSGTVMLTFHIEVATGDGVSATAGVLALEIRLSIRELENTSVLSPLNLIYTRGVLKHKYHIDYFIQDYV